MVLNSKPFSPGYGLLQTIYGTKVLTILIKNGLLQITYGTKVQTILAWIRFTVKDLLYYSPIHPSLDVFTARSLWY